LLRQGPKTRRDTDFTRINGRQSAHEDVARRTKLDRRTVKAYLEKKPV
jgi:hypothetical protein